MIPITKPTLSVEEAKAAYDCVMSGWVVQGPQVEAFEKSFSSYIGCEFAVAVSSCTTALHLSMIVSGVKPGDEVICPSLSYVATANSIMHAGATPVFAEVLPGTYNLDPVSVEKMITNKTRAILLVHQVGIPAEIDLFKKMCHQYNLILIEDAACALGSEYHGEKIGTHSDLVCFSFHPRKVITTGDGGMITTKRRDYYEKLRLLRQHGMDISASAREKAGKMLFEKHLIIGYNYRMTDIQASVGVNQMKRLDSIISERRRQGLFYNENFSKIEWLDIPVIPIDCEVNFQSYVLHLNDKAPISRDDLIIYLAEKGISSRRGIMCAHTEPAYTSQGETYFLPVSEELNMNSLIIPLYPGLSENEQQYIVDIFHSI